MRPQLARMIAEPLADGVTGAVVQLAALTLDGTDARPEAPVAIINQADNAAAIKPAGLIDWPVLVVAPEFPASYSFTGVHQLFQLDVKSLQVTVADVGRDNVDPEQAWRDASYRLTAALKALLAGLFAADKAAARSRAGVDIVKLNKADIYPALQKMEKGGTVYGSLILDLYVRHTL